MAPLLQDNTIRISKEEREEALRELYKEIEKGIWSLENEKVYTIEEAWEELEKL